MKTLLALLFVPSLAFGQYYGTPGQQAATAAALGAMQVIQQQYAPQYPAQNPYSNMLPMPSYQEQRIMIEQEYLMKAQQRYLDSLRQDNNMKSLESIFNDVNNKRRQ